MAVSVFIRRWVFLLLLEMGRARVVQKMCSMELYDLNPAGQLNMETILRRFLAVSNKIWQPIVREAIDICHGRLLIDATLEERTLNGCRLQPALFSSCVRRNMLANCPQMFRPKTDSNSCTQRLELIKDRCDPFAAVSVFNEVGPSIAREVPAETQRPNALHTTSTLASIPTTTIVSSTASKTIPPTTTVVSSTVSATIPPTTKLEKVAEATVVAEKEGTLIDSPSIDDEILDASPAFEGQDDEFPDAPDMSSRGIEDIGRSLVTIQRQIRHIEKLETIDEREKLAGQMREQLDSVSEDVEQLGQSRPEVLQVAPRLERIREELGGFGRLSIADGLGTRLILEVDSVRNELQRVANNIRQGINEAGDTIRHNVSNVALGVADEALGLSKAVGAGLQNAGAAFKAGVDSAQSGIVSLSLEGTAQLQKVGTDISAGVSSVKTNFENLRQESFQRIRDSSDSLNVQLVSGLQRLQKLREESTMGAQSLALNIQKNIQERLDDISKQFGSIRLPG